MSVGADARSTQAEVELYYGNTLADNVGHALTGIGVVALLAVALVVRRGRCA